MSAIQAILEEIKHSPQLPDAIAELNAFWEDEQRRRLQFYNDLDEDMKAEFIDGQVVMHSPAKDEHNLTRELLSQVARTYANENALGKARSEKALVKLRRNDFEPDMVFFGNEKAAAIEGKTLLYPAPDWVCEVLSPGTEQYDRKVKFQDYAGNGVQEYWIIDPDKRVVEIYDLVDGHYELRTKTSSGILESIAIAGFAIPIEAIFDERACTDTVMDIVHKARGLK